MKITDKAYVAVRQDTDGLVWPDYNTFSHLLAETRRKAREFDSRVTGFAESNPVITYTQITITGRISA